MSTTTPVDWELWQRILMAALVVDKFKRLAKALGRWHIYNKGQDGWFTTPDGKELFSVINQKWFAHTEVVSRQQTKTFSREK